MPVEPSKAEDILQWPLHFKITREVDMGLLGDEFVVNLTYGGVDLLRGEFVRNCLTKNTSEEAVLETLRFLKHIALWAHKQAIDTGLINKDTKWEEL